MRNGRAPAGFRPNGWPFGLQSRSRLGTFEPAKNLESGEVLALGNPCETAEPLQDSGPMGGRLVCRADLVWAPLNPLKAWRVERYWRWATHAKQHSPSRIQAQWVAVWSAEPMSFGHLWTREKPGEWRGIGAGQPMRNGRAPAGFRPNGWPFGLQSRCRLGTFEPAKNLESGEVLALGNPCETAEHLQSRHLRSRWKHGGIGAGQPMRNGRAPAGFRPNGWPFGLQSRCRLGTFEPAKKLESGEVLALGNPCETAEPQQDSGPMGGRLVCRADVVWAPLNPLKTWRVERYWRWATHAKQQSTCRADRV